MKIILRLLFLTLFIFSCDSPTESEPEGCDGISGSGLVIDECGNCPGEEVISVKIWGDCYDIDSTIVLECNNCSLDDIPDEIESLLNLQELKLGNNDIIQLPDFITSLSNLKVLEVFNNQLTELPSNIGNLVNLESLKVYENELSCLPESICDIPVSCSIDLRYNNICPECIYECIDITDNDDLGIQDTSDCP